MQLILGSSSQFRQNQLKQLGLDFTCVSPNIDEEAIKNDGISPLEVSRQLSLQKAQEVLKNNPEAIIIGGDQVLNFNGDIFNKPETIENAISHLKKLQGKTHELITSIAVISKDKQVVETVVSKMTMKELSDEQIERYVVSDEPLWSCGAYKLETQGIALFDQIECPDHSSIIGLPLIALSKILPEFGIDVL
ncbi:MULTISPECIES: Maf family protein [Halobacteriovorax]|uniref:7-methyl-GTP pyrophosphatase n=1 Tax=Halobacteriovorax vibrionivorans TaxID=2152716 RepID=A0ABY0IC84_9BACT|nr:nucleoside triphosphate pyrophosphatase [Halobacteriovorax vibrionivorans]RZF20576.1 septum formation protein Maf [Halobacteriovorax vibrionivorans]